ncbi:MAG: DNA polymerase III subunit beta [Stagnimonas sp.]|nr:DNA polymerase III subunit beta [Stagnimonas sp.]
MHIIHVRNELLGALSTVVGVVERRQTLPILSNVLLEARDAELMVRATDLEIEMEVSIPVQNLKAGKLTAPARKLHDILRGLPEGAEISFESTDESRMTVKSGKSRFALATLSADEFPSLGGVQAETQLTLTHKQLRDLINRVSFAMAQQDVRYYLNGMLLHVGPNFVRAVATDGHRLALSELVMETGIAEEMQLILPRKAVLELARLLDGGDAPVTLGIGGGQIQVQLTNLRITSKLIDGRFPDYERVVPESQDRRVEGGRVSVRSALSRAAILSNEKFRGVRLQLEGSTLRIQTQNPEREEAEEEVEVALEGEPMEIGFNVTYLLDALDAMTTDNFIMELRGPDASGLLFETGETTHSKYVVMPMRL